MWEALENTQWVQTMGSTGWMYATIAVTHYISMFWFIGSMAVVDLRVMGLTARDRTIREIAQQLFPWAWMGFALAMISGFLLFATAAGDWAPSPGFHRKLTFIALAVVFAVIVQTLAPKWSETKEPPPVARIIALVALLLWVATIVSGSLIPSLEGLG
jgi:hypothetical protein